MPWLPAGPLPGREHELDPQPGKSGRSPVLAPRRLRPLQANLHSRTLFVHGNAHATANNIATHELLFRLGMVSDLFCGTILILLALAPYRLLKEMDQNLRSPHPTRVTVAFQGRRGQVAVDQLRPVDRRRLVRKLGKVSSKSAHEISLLLIEMFTRR